MQDAIKIHPQDNVAVALHDMEANTTIELAAQPVTLLQDVGRGHKFALRAIGKDELIIKYG
ncbi:UxaA family hydrolase, partial [Pantoea ananatis]